MPDLNVAGAMAEVVRPNSTEIEKASALEGEGFYAALDPST